MASIRKVMDAVVGARGDSNIKFRDLRRLLIRFGFVERTKGGHYIFTRDGVVEIINLQPLSGGMAKAYQVKQVREIITRYSLSLRT